MARTTPRPEPTAHCTLLPLTTTCPACGASLSLDYCNQRTVTTLDDVLRLRLGIRRCHLPTCPRQRKPLRPEAEGRIALPHHEFGLDVVALVGSLRYRQHKSLPDIHQELTARRLVLARRSVCNLLDRYDELRALAAMDPARLHPLLREIERVAHKGGRRMNGNACRGESAPAWRRPRNCGRRCVRASSCSSGWRPC